MLFIIGCTSNIKEDIRNSETKIITKYIYKENTSKYDVLDQKHNELIKKYNNLIKESNSIGHKVLDECINKGSSISIPERVLTKKTICRGNCDEYLYCNSQSMLPFFECKDKLTVYTNIKKEDIQICDIIGFKTPDYPKLKFIIHQVINITENGYQTKGIGNYLGDNYIVKFKDIKFKLIKIEYAPIITWGEKPYWDD